MWSSFNPLKGKLRKSTLLHLDLPYAMEKECFSSANHYILSILLDLIIFKLTNTRVRSYLIWHFQTKSTPLQTNLKNFKSKVSVF